jgi:molybdate transport repressor ModE-like protein
MNKIVIRPSWVFESESGERVESQLFVLLRGIEEHGRLTAAARQAGLSYRHAWDLVGRWSRFFGTPLAEMQRGRGARLTALGARLLWAEQRSEASLHPQLENIASELNLEIGRAREAARTVVRLHASHGYAVERIPALLQGSGLADVDLQYMSSMAALASLARGDCLLAGFHVPCGAQGAILWPHYEGWLQARQHRLIRLVLRTQGLIVPRGNPRGLKGLADLVQPGLRFANRQAGSGTRILLDGLLRQAGVDATRIPGYDRGEFTHAAVAAYVASGMADAAFGVEPAARQFRLDFLPVIREHYLLACHRDSLELAPVRELLRLLQGPDFARQIEEVPGYDLDQPGQVVSAVDFTSSLKASVDSGPAHIKRAT